MEYRPEYLTVKHLMPLLIVSEEEAGGGPGQLRTFSLQQLPGEIRRLTGLGLDSCKIYVRNPASRKDAQASCGLARDSLMVQAVQAIKDADPGMQVGTEVCACAYSSRGECVLLDGAGHIDHAATHDMVAEMALLHVEAGADVLVAGLTHPGSVRAMRTALDAGGYQDRSIMASVQLRTAFYAPYRRLMGTEPEAGETFRSHLSADDPEAVLSRVKDLVEEGAESLSLQPVMIAPDLVRLISSNFDLPLMAFSVSSELNLVRDGQSPLWLAPGQAQLLAEYYNMLIRMGASSIQSYVAGDLAEWLIDR